MHSLGRQSFIFLFICFSGALLQLEHFKKTLQGDQSIPESPGGQPQPDDDTTAEVDERGQTEFDADPSALFKQFYFLLDTKEAIAPLKIEDGKAPKSADTPFWQELAEDISGSGGTIVSCDDPRCDPSPI